MENVREGIIYYGVKLYNYGDEHEKLTDDLRLKTIRSFYDYLIDRVSKYEKGKILTIHGRTIYATWSVESDPIHLIYKIIEFCFNISVDWQKKMDPSMISFLTNFFEIARPYRINYKVNEINNVTYIGSSINLCEETLRDPSTYGKNVTLVGPDIQSIIKSDKFLEINVKRYHTYPVNDKVWGVNVD